MDSNSACCFILIESLIQYDIIDLINLWHGLYRIVLELKATDGTPHYLAAEFNLSEYLGRLFYIW